jgi:hypothetical protein
LTVNDIETLVRRAEAGDESTVPALRRLLQAPRGVAALGGDLAAKARRVLIDKYAGTNVLARETLVAKLEQLRADLGGDTPVERLMVDRIVTCWLHLHHLEWCYAVRDPLPIGLATYYQRSMDRAQKRYLAALKTLATVRRLALPALQVNIGGNQVNVAGP